MFGSTSTKLAGILHDLTVIKGRLEGVDHLTRRLEDTLDELRRLENRLRMRDVRAGKANGTEGGVDPLDAALLRHRGL